MLHTYDLLMPVSRKSDSKTFVSNVNKKSKGPSGKVFIGGYVSKAIHRKLKKVATAQRRSLNAQIEIFLAAGVAHPAEQSGN